MRPVERGPMPLEASGALKVISEWGNARADLYAMLGRYCSYCERCVSDGLDVEHVLPKERRPDKKLEWHNFLLACKNCNSTKGSKVVNRKKLLLPNQDNTFRAFDYLKGGLIVPQAALPSTAKQKAQATIRLIGLDKTPRHNPKASDMRWNDRRETWDMAERYLKKFENKLISSDVIIDLCLLKGHWSIWMTVFAAHPAVRLSLISRFPGTTQTNCFDAYGEPIARLGGQL